MYTLVEIGVVGGIMGMEGWGELLQRLQDCAKANGKNMPKRVLHRIHGQVTARDPVLNEKSGWLNLGAAEG